MVRSAASRVSNHEAPISRPSFETRASPAPLDEGRLLANSPQATRNDDLSQAKDRTRRWTLFRRAALARGTALVRRLHGTDAAQPCSLRRVRAAREIRRRHAVRPRGPAGRQADRVDDVSQAPAGL